MSRFMVLLTLIVVTFSVRAQQGLSQPKGTKPPAFVLEGTLKNEVNNSSIEYATIVLISTKDSTIVDGTISDTAGYFRIESYERKVYLRITCMGFEPIVKNDLGQQPYTDMGTLMMRPQSQHLQGVEIRAERSEMIFKMDKRVFNVGQDLVNSGGSVLDVLNNVPSVDVNIQGTVSLRGNANVKILINGKPSVLTDGNSLGSITAEMIDRVEVVTNPSAKYDAEGTSGIINIILKKEDNKGWNGAVTLNTGLPQNHSLGFSLNRRTEKFNVFTQLGVGKRKLIMTDDVVTTDRSLATEPTIESYSNGEKNELFTNVILGADYHINKWNVLTLTGHLAYEWEDEFADIDYTFKEGEDAITATSLRKEVSEAVNPKWEFDLNYNKTFRNNKEHQLNVSANGSFFGKSKTLSYQNINTFPQDYVSEERANSEFSEPSYVFQADYTNPFSEESALEAGFKSVLNRADSDYDYYDKVDSLWVLNTNYTNAFTFRQWVHAAYVTYAYKWDKVGAKVGLRAEQTEQNLSSESQANDVSQEYAQLFPSMHLSYEFSKGNFLQVGYSRRIQRPDMHKLNPFISYSDKYNLHQGNGELLPEMSHALEVSAGRIRSKYSLNGSVYYRHTTDVISQVVYLKDSVSISTYDNMGRSQNTGVELNLKYSPTKWLTLMGDGNLFFYHRTGQNQGADFDFNSVMGMSRLTAKLKFLKTFDAEVRVRYRSKHKDVITTSLANTSMDLGLKKKFGKGKSVLHLSVRDVFNSRLYSSVMDTDELYRYSSMRWGGRQIVLGFSYSFGKGEAMEFSGQKMF